MDGIKDFSLPPCQVVKLMPLLIDGRNAQNALEITRTFLLQLTFLCALVFFFQFLSSFTGLHCIVFLPIVEKKAQFLCVFSLHKWVLFGAIVQARHQLGRPQSLMSKHRQSVCAVPLLPLLMHLAIPMRTCKFQKIQACLVAGRAKKREVQAKVPLKERASHKGQFPLVVVTLTDQNLNPKEKARTCLTQ